MSEAISGALVGVDPAYRSAHAGYLLPGDLPAAQAKKPFTGESTK